MPRYCPLGTPSLLDGDFWENAARLKDFSWSVLLSSNPNKTDFADENSKFLRWLQENPLVIFSDILSKFIYISIYSILCYALISCVKIKLTRNLVVNVVSFRTLLIVSLTSALVFFRIGLNVPYVLFLMVNIHILLFSDILLFKCSYLSPSKERLRKFRIISLRIAGVILAVLVFLFTPIIPHKHDECPDEFLRFMSEMYFWISFFLIYYCIRCIERMIYYHQSDVFYIWQYSWIIPFCYYRYKSVGKMKKKEGFGWITRYYSTDSAITKKTEPSIV